MWNILTAILKHPGLNLSINIIMMIFQFIMAAIQHVEGDNTAAFTFLISGLSCSTAIFYWILIWWAAKK